MSAIKLVEQRNERFGVDNYLQRLQQLVEKQGPEEADYNTLQTIAKGLSKLSIENELRLHETIKPVLTMDCIIGHVFLKPFGYAGDYQLIDKIHTKKITENQSLRKWDVYFHEADSATAVRNRKQYFKLLLSKLARQNRKISVLNIGSGPCRDIYEFLTENESNNLHFDCLDMDSNAIEYASNLCKPFKDKINFLNENILRSRLESQYDLIWSAGLFDYFSDKVFTRLVSKLYKNVKPQGELVIGNFSTENPGKEEMEVFGQWYLNHRSKKQLISCALRAGIDENHLAVEQEQLGVNLFLHMRKQST